MTQEEEQLLFDDLSGRLRYGVICQIDYHDDAVLWGIPNRDTFTFCDGVIERYISQVKPYLRPMSSMTEEERDEFRKVGGVMSYSPQHDTWVISAFAPEAYDLLNKNKFDYRGLIPKGLALGAPEDMYKTK